MDNVVLRMKNIEKYFVKFKALKSACFELKKGEIHALVGENGAGKSTLMKILSGVYQRDGGEIEIFGKSVDFSGIKQSRDAGIAIIHQELNLINQLTVAQNIYIGREPIKYGFMIDDNKMKIDASRLFERMGESVDPTALLGSLSVGKKQLVEIAKALSLNSQILILDEPTAALGEVEVGRLFEIMNELKNTGVSMIYISHRIDEVQKISDRITVMRDGESVGTLVTRDAQRQEIINMMVGRVVYDGKKLHSSLESDAQIVLEIKNLNSTGIKNVSFKLKKGEILGFAGLVGSGRTRLARTIYGAEKFDSGEIFINGVRVDLKNPAVAVKKGICYLSEDRRRCGLLLEKSVADNTVLSSLENYIKAGFISQRSILKSAITENNRLGTKYASVNQAVSKLSGGNQQKVIVARWLLRNCDILIFDEPTRGIDIGAKGQIYKIIESLANQGKAIIMISSEINEIQRLSDRVVVMCEGRITGELGFGQITSQEIMRLATYREE
ncbi:MAG: sugar ABC transporter ATP-binding protein [bacterium]|nr:sugar ABC transporter ATP-binding protein [bacterium]